MADYKRKKFKKNFKPKRSLNAAKSTSTHNTKKTKNKTLPESDIKVVRGAKLKHKRRMNFFLTFAAFVIFVCIILSLILPVSLYENIVTATSLLGHGVYPQEIAGTSVLNSTSNGSYYYVLTDTNITAYSNSGKVIFSEMHGLANPILSVSHTRALVFDQGGKIIYVYNLNGLIDSFETENEIINANISRSGAFAVSTHSDNYTSVVNVYDKNSKQIFTWNSAKDIVNNVLVNPKGNRLAVSTLNAVSGQYESKLLILDFDSADPLYTLELNNSIALSLTNTGRGISIFTNDKYKFVNWSKFTVTDISVSGELNIFRKTKNGLLLVFNRSNDRSDNTIILVSNKGKKISEFKINNLITDIQYTNGRIYYIGDTTVNILDKEGTVLRDGVCDYGTSHFMVISSNSVAVITDNEIIKTTIEKRK